MSQAQVGTAAASDTDLASQRPSPFFNDSPPSPSLPPPSKNRDTSFPVSIQNVGKKGLGVIACATIPPGKVILSERPFIKFREPVTATSVTEAVNTLDAAGQQLFWSLSGGGVYESRVLDLAENNMLDLDGEEGVCGIFETLCRINHSCGPNCRWRYDASTKRMDLRSLRLIKRGEELSVSYLEQPDLLSDERRDLIETRHTFRCRCDVCIQSTESVMTSDNVRAMVRESFAKWELLPIDEWHDPDLSAAQNRTRTLEVISCIERRLIDEGLQLFLARLYEYRFEIHAAWGELAEAKAAGEQWRETDRVVAFKDEREDIQLDMIRRDPTKWGQWAKLAGRKQSFARKAANHQAAKPTLKTRRRQ